MSALRERTNYLKIVDGAVIDFEKDGGWVEVVETADGGAVVKPQVEMLDFLDRIYAKSVERAEETGEFLMEVQNGEVVVFKEKNGEVMLFNRVMSLVFD